MKLPTVLVAAFVLIACEQDKNLGNPHKDGGSDAPTTGAAGATGTGGGAGTTGGASGTGGAAGPAGAGAAGTAGGGTGGATGTGGTGGAAPSGRRWLAFNDERGAFVYDLNRFPASDALVQLSSSDGWPGNVWSPDGRTVLHYGSGGLFARDMSGNQPGQMNLIASGNYFSWSNDSRSLAVVNGMTLRTLDPHQSAPVLRVVTTTLANGFVSWSPAGMPRMQYLDGTGGHVVEVQAGVPGTVVDLPSTGIWSPVGNQIALKQGGNLTLVDLDGATPATRVVTAPTVASPTITYVEFNHDGTLLAYYGSQTRAETDVFVVSTTPGATPVNVHPALAAGESASFATAIGFDPRTPPPAWSPGASWLVTSVLMNNVVSAGYAIDLRTGVAGTATTITASGTLSWGGIGKVLALVATPVPAEIRLTDLTMQMPQPALLVSESMSGTTIARFKVGSSSLGYTAGLDLKIVSLDPPMRSPAVVTLGSTFDTDVVRTWEWSPDGQFIVAIPQREFATYTRDRLQLFRVDDGLASGILTLSAESAAGISFAWQP
jgi:Tol biopolymer transport system component